MRNPHAHLSQDIGAIDCVMAPTRDGFGTGVVEAGTVDARVVVLCADLKESTRSELFEATFPDRFVEVGIAEQNMAAVAAGMAAIGKVPFITSYAAFNPGRNYEHIRTTIALNQAKVIVCGMHAGVSVGPDGATHQMLEDIGLMRMLPHMTVLAPADAEEARKAVIAAAQAPGPVYIRLGRAPTPVFTTTETPFRIGTALSLFEPEQPVIALMATGALSHTALCAAEQLSHEGIAVSVLHIPTIKPLDTDAVITAAQRAGRVVTLEEHQIAGGFGSAIAECLSQAHPVPQLRLGIQDQFGQSGTPSELLSHYGLSCDKVVESVRSWVTAK